MKTRVRVLFLALLGAFVFTACDLVGGSGGGLTGLPTREPAIPDTVDPLAKIEHHPFTSKGSGANGEHEFRDLRTETRIDESDEYSWINAYLDSGFVYSMGGYQNVSSDGGYLYLIIRGAAVPGNGIPLLINLGNQSVINLPDYARTSQDGAPTEWRFGYTPTYDVSTRRIGKAWAKVFGKITHVRKYFSTNEAEDLIGRKYTAWELEIYFDVNLTEIYYGEGKGKRAASL